METAVISVRPSLVRKRDGVTTQLFDSFKIENAVRKAWETVEPVDEMLLSKVSAYVTNGLPIGEVADVESIQDAVEFALMDFDKKSVAKAYILYRDKKSQLRAQRKIPDPDAISDYMHPAKYGKFLEELNRRELYGETVDRVRVMHLKRFPQLRSELNKAFDMVAERQILPSLRSFQFAGEAIEKNNARQYNCSFTLVDRIDAFSEILYLLLCGCGVGYSVQTQHVDQLPPMAIVDEYKVEWHRAEDSIEGWADCARALFSGHLRGVYVDFDFSGIRPAGSILKTSGGRAPGHLGLKRAIERVRAILTQAGGRKLKPIEAYDINCHFADAVLSGGIRRSATLSLFSVDDIEMMTSKTGNWYETHPWRANSNNSAALIRSSATRSQFAQLFVSTKEFGEPGFVFLNNPDTGVNPCQPGWATVLTPEGIRTFNDISVGSTIWSGNNWTKVINKISTGVKPVYAFNTRAGIFNGTNNHRVVSDGEKIEAEYAESIDVAKGGAEGNESFDLDVVMDGIVIGDGTVHKASNNLILLEIGADDQDYLTSEISNHILIKRPGVGEYAWEIKTSVLHNELPVTYLREIPERYRFGSERTVRSFLRGLYTANGSVCGGRITLKQTSFSIISSVQEMLSSLGISSYYTINKESVVKFSNGEYTCKQSYDLNITSDRARFRDLIGVIQKYKSNNINMACDGIKSNGRCKKTYEIVSKDYIGDEQVYDITVDDPAHTYWTGGLLVSNCGEILMFPVCYVDSSNIYRFLARGQQVSVGDRISGVAFCNLTVINAAKLTSLDDFKEAARAATLIGTVQASYTSFPYLGVASEIIAERDALLGVSMTGMLDNPAISCNPEYQKYVAGKIVGWNKEFAGQIGINSAARLTCVKPEGSSSLILKGVASGHHPHHARRSIRRITANPLEPVFRYFKSVNGHMCVRKPNGDYVIEFLTEAPPGAILKGDVSAIDFLDMVKSTQLNWVIPGTARPESAFNGSHNVSNTVQVRANEWEQVEEYIWNNRDIFSGVSLLPATGDKIYQYAPNEAITTTEDEARWNQIIDNYTKVDYSLMIEDEDQTNRQGELSCAGGACLI